MADTEQGSPSLSQESPEQEPQERQVPQVPTGHVGHGNSVAAWTAVAIILVAGLVMSIAVATGTTWLFIAGAVLAVLGVIAGKVLATMGFGVGGRHR
jgi:hypothetical protein